MKKDSNYIDNVLIKLRRQYSKDEYVNALIRILKEKDVEIGALKAEVDFLLEKLKVSKETRIEVKKQDLYKKKNEEIRSQRATIKYLTDERDSLISKLYLLKLKLESK